MRRILLIILLLNFLLISCSNKDVIRLEENIEDKKNNINELDNIIISLEQEIQELEKAINLLELEKNSTKIKYEDVKTQLDLKNNEIQEIRNEIRDMRNEFDGNIEYLQFNETKKFIVNKKLRMLPYENSNVYADDLSGIVFVKDKVKDSNNEIWCFVERSLVPITKGWIKETGLRDLPYLEIKKSKESIAGIHIGDKIEDAKQILCNDYVSQPTELYIEFNWNNDIVIYMDILTDKVIGIILLSDKYLTGKNIKIGDDAIETLNLYENYYDYYYDSRFMDKESIHTFNINDEIYMKFKWSNDNTSTPLPNNTSIPVSGDIILYIFLYHAIAIP